MILDKILFGNKKSEAAHAFSGDGTKKSGGARISRKIKDSHYGADLTFTMKIDPVGQNYITLRLSGDEEYSKAVIYIGEYQLGYLQCGDYEPIINDTPAFLPNRFYYVTQMLPFSFTRGKTELMLSIRPVSAWGECDPKGKYFAAYTHTGAHLDVSGDEQGAPPRKKNAPKSERIGDVQKYIDAYIDAQNEEFIRCREMLDDSPDAVLSIEKYKENFRFFYMELMSSRRKNDAKREDVLRVLKCINNYVKIYFRDVRTLAHMGHQSDWGGSCGDLGQALYIIKPLLFDEKVFGKAAFDDYLNQKFDCDSRRGEFSMSAKNLTRRAAWERCLKANYDFASSRQSYIYNQVYYTYEGAWKAMAGLGVMQSRYYVGDEECKNILREALGIAPWLGEHILTSKRGRTLDLYHCLFNHDKNAVFTDDCIQVVCRGKAKHLCRREPYGRHYTGLTHQGMTRENGYVGNYGETANYLFEWVCRTEKNDPDLSDEIMKYALKNFHSRSVMRVKTRDKNGRQVRRMVQAIDERNPSLSGKIAYGTIPGPHSFGFAALAKKLEDKRYAAPEWDEYKTYAKEAVALLFEQDGDGQLKGVLDAFLKRRDETPDHPAWQHFGRHSYVDFRIDETLGYVFGKKAQKYEKPSAWADIDNMNIYFRDGETEIYAALNERNKGYFANGRVWARHKNYEQLAQVETDGAWQSRSYFIRNANKMMDFFADRDFLGDVLTAKQALAGEVVPVTYQKGVGEVLRENYETDHPYSGYCDLLKCRYGRYLMMINTTRSEYRNAREFEVKLPASCKKSAVRDFLSGREIEIHNGCVKVAPFTAMALDLGAFEDKTPLPPRVAVTIALDDADGVHLWWKAAPRAKSYTVFRDGAAIAAGLTDNYFIDKTACKITRYSYSVAAENEFGRGEVSCEAVITAALSEKKRVGRGKFSFGSGDDYKAQSRVNIRDSLTMLARVYRGDAVLKGDAPILRENASDNCRCVALFFEGGKIIFAARSRDTTYYGDGKPPVSPVRWEFPCGEYKFLKLTRDFDSHYVTAYASKDGRRFKKLCSYLCPMPEIIYAGEIEK